MAAVTIGPIDLACLCSLDDNENIVAYNKQCPLHSHLATPEKVIVQRWCEGSSEAVRNHDRRSGWCRACGNLVPAKYGYAGVHLPDGTTPSV
jgi:hypothetical protein